MNSIYSTLWWTARRTAQSSASSALTSISTFALSARDGRMDYVNDDLHELMPSTPEADRATATILSYADALIGERRDRGAERRSLAVSDDLWRKLAALRTRSSGIVEGIKGVQIGQGRPHWRGFLKRSWKADRLTSHRLLLARRVDQDTSTLTRTWGRPVAMARFDQSEVLSAHEPIRPLADFRLGQSA